MIKSFGIKHYTMHQINELGVGTVCREVVDWTKDYPVHVSFDIDAIDPAFAPATGTLSRGGLTDREALFILQKLYLSQRLVGLDMVEINPLLDDKVRGSQLQNQPQGKKQAKDGVNLGVELIQAALGRGLLQ